MYSLWSFILDSLEWPCLEFCWSDINTKAFNQWNLGHTKMLNSRHIPTTVLASNHCINKYYPPPPPVDWSSSGVWSEGLKSRPNRSWMVSTKWYPSIGCSSLTRESWSSCCVVCKSWMSVSGRGTLSIVTTLATASRYSGSGRWVCTCMC